MTIVKIEVTYKGPLDTDLDDKIRKHLKSIGAVWYAQGMNFITGVRDFAFDWDLEEVDKGA